MKVESIEISAIDGRFPAKYKLFSKNDSNSAKVVFILAILSAWMFWSPKKKTGRLIDESLIF